MGVNMNKIDTLYEKMDVISSKVEEMVYAINDMKGKWTILKGWYGCQSGQGDILEQGVLEKDVSKKIKKYSNFCYFHYVPGPDIFGCRIKPGSPKSK